MGVKTLLVFLRLFPIGAHESSRGKVTAYVCFKQKEQKTDISLDVDLSVCICEITGAAKNVTIGKGEKMEFESGKGWGFFVVVRKFS